MLPSRVVFLPQRTRFRHRRPSLSGPGAAADGTLRLWETSTGRALATLQGSNGTVWCVSLSADGHMVASGGEDGTVRLWDVGTRRALATLEGHAVGVQSVALSATGH